jgi:curved DNA-binding protein CbpA
VPADAYEAQIRDAYYTLVARLHPDLYVETLDPVTRSKLVTVYSRLVEAYRVCADGKRREQYDRNLTQGRLRWSPETEKVQTIGPGSELKNANAKKFFKLAQEALRAHNGKAAVMNLKLALSQEPDSLLIKGELTRRRRSVKTQGGWSWPATRPRTIKVRCATWDQVECVLHAEAEGRHARGQDAGAADDRRRRHRGAGAAERADLRHRRLGDLGGRGRHRRQVAGGDEDARADARGPRSPGPAGARRREGLLSAPAIAPTDAPGPLAAGTQSGRARAARSRRRLTAPRRSRPIPSRAWRTSSSRSSRPSRRSSGPQAAPALPAHEVLGVPFDGDMRAIRAGYFALARQHHPDAYGRYLSPALRRLASELFIHVNRAYDRMREAALRASGVSVPGPAARDGGGWVIDASEVMAAPQEVYIAVNAPVAAPAAAPAAATAAAAAAGTAPLPVPPPLPVPRRCRYRCRCRARRRCRYRCRCRPRAAAAAAHGAPGARRLRAHGGLAGRSARGRGEPPRDLAAQLFDDLPVHTPICPSTPTCRRAPRAPQLRQRRRAALAAGTSTRRARTSSPRCASTVATAPCARSTTSPRGCSCAPGRGRGGPDCSSRTRCATIPAAPRRCVRSAAPARSPGAAPEEADVRPVIRSIGIDLGTTNSCVASIDASGQPRISRTARARARPRRWSRSATAGKVLVGAPARRQLLTAPRETIFAVKRLIGRRWDDPEILRLARTLPYGVRAAENGDAWVDIAGQARSPQEISAHVLDAVRQVAQEQLGGAAASRRGHHHGARALSTPRTPGDQGRRRDRRAARAPPAQRADRGGARLRRAQGRARARRVCDLGGGTFDVSILERRRRRLRGHRHARRHPARRRGHRSPHRRAASPTTSATRHGSTCSPIRRCSGACATRPSG